MSINSYHSHIPPTLLDKSELDALVITYVMTSSGVSLPLSYYGEQVWDYTPYFPHAARGQSDKEIRWEKTPAEWIASLKGVAAAFTHRKRPDGNRLGLATIPKRIITLNAFAKWCSKAGISRFQDVTSFDLARYIQKLREDGVVDRTLGVHIGLLRRVYGMRMHLLDSFTVDAVKALSFEQVGPLWEPEAAKERQTELIPLAEASRLFSASLAHLDKAEFLLTLRDELDTDWLAAKAYMDRKKWGDSVKSKIVRSAGFKDIHEFQSSLTDLRTAAYIVLAQSTGCRVHELGDIRVGCVYSELLDGENYWWLKSTTRKIGDGPERWLAPEIAKKVVDILEWYSAPLRKIISSEIESIKRLSEYSLSQGDIAKWSTRILELKRNSDRLFLSESSGKVTSTDTKAHNKQLAAFARRRGIILDSPLTTHRFRRTYAVIVVHLNKGARIDLITLQHHYKHASVLMTEWYAALPETDKDLFDLIEEEGNYFDLALIDHWMEPSTPLAGGFGARLKAYPGRHHQPLFFKTRREFVQSIRDDLNIRSTGHSWCLADSKDCGGRGLFETARCCNCANGVVDDHFSDVWSNIRTQHAELVEIADIGPGGREKAKKGLEAAEAVLAQLTPSEMGD